jgi:hypothetical protein
MCLQGACGGNVQHQSGRAELIAHHAGARPGAAATLRIVLELDSARRSDHPQALAPFALRCNPPQLCSALANSLGAARLDSQCRLEALQGSACQRGRTAWRVRTGRIPPA